MSNPIQLHTLRREGRYDAETHTFCVAGEVVYIRSSYGRSSGQTEAYTREQAREMYRSLRAKGLGPSEQHNMLLLGSARVEARTYRESFGASASMDADVQLTAQDAAPVIGDLRPYTRELCGVCILRDTERPATYTDGRYVVHQHLYTYEAARWAVEGRMSLSDSRCVITEQARESFGSYRQWLDLHMQH